MAREDEWYGGSSPHHPFHLSSGHGPRRGPNMLRPGIHAPILSKPRAANSSSSSKPPQPRQNERSTTSTGPLDETHRPVDTRPASRAARLPRQLSSRLVMATGQDHCRAPTARPRLNHEVHGSTGGASGGPAGASIERRSEQHPCLQLPMSCSRLIRVDEAGPSRNLINNRCQPTKISAHAHRKTSVTKGIACTSPIPVVRRCLRCPDLASLCQAFPRPVTCWAVNECRKTTAATRVPAP